MPPSIARANWFLKIFSFGKIPMIFWLRPRVIALTEDKVEIRIPLNRRSKNHLNSMYFGALATGADLAGAFLAFMCVHESKQKMSFVFKDFQARFLKRAEGDVHFVCTSGAAIKAFVDQAARSGERVELTVPVVATVPTKTGAEPIAEFLLTMSLKRSRASPKA